MKPRSYSTRSGRGCGQDRREPFHGADPYALVVTVGFLARTPLASPLPAQAAGRSVS